MIVDEDNDDDDEDDNDGNTERVFTSCSSHNHLPPTASPKISGILILATLIMTLMTLILMWMRLLMCVAGDEDSDMNQVINDADHIVEAEGIRQKNRMGGVVSLTVKCPGGFDDFPQCD